MNYKIIKNEDEILKLDERIRYDFLNSRNRVKVEKILNGYLFVLVISINKMVVVFLNENEMIFRSFGFDIENYISNNFSETLFRLFQEIGTNEIDKLREELKNLEDKVFSKIDYPKLDKSLLKSLYFYKKSIDELARYYFLQEDLLEEIEIDRKVLFQIRRIRTALEKISSLANSLIEIYLEMIDTVANEIMKFLTIIATIFIPLSFLAGVYGMNFEYIPELKWKFGYFLFWIICIIFSIFSIFYFKKKKWI